MANDSIDLASEYEVPAAAAPTDLTSEYEAPSVDDLVDKVINENPIDRYLNSTALGPARRAIGREMLTRGGHIGDIALNIALPLGGALAGTELGPGGIAAGGAAGAVTADRLVQARQIVRGERKDFSTGETIGAGVTGAAQAFLPEVKPAASLIGNVAKKVLVRGAEGAGLGEAQQGISDLIDEGKIDFKKMAETGAWSALFGAGFGSLEGTAPAAFKWLAGLGKTSPSEVAAAIPAQIAKAKTPEDLAALEHVKTTIDNSVGLNLPAKSAADSASVLDEAPRSAAEAAGSFEGVPIRASDIEIPLQENQVQSEGSTPLLSGADRQIESLDARKSLEAPEEDLPDMSAQAQSMYDKYGYVNKTLMGAVAGGGSGAVYGSTQGDTLKDRALNAGLYGLLGAAGGAALMRGLAGRLRELPVEEQIPAIEEQIQNAASPEIKTALEQTKKILTAKQQVIAKYPDTFNADSDLVNRQLPIEVRGKNGQVYPALMNGYYDLGDKAVPSIARQVEGGWSHGMLADGEKIVTPHPTAEQWTQGVREINHADPVITVQEMGGKRAVQVEVPGVEGERPAFSGTPEEAIDRGYISQLPEDLPAGKYQYSDLENHGLIDSESVSQPNDQTPTSGGSQQQGLSSDGEQNQQQPGSGSAPQEYPSTLGNTSGFVSRGLIRNAVLPGVGGLAGSAYGATQGNTPEERRANAAKYGLLGLGAGSILGRFAFPEPGARLSSIKGLATGTDDLPEWFLKVRDTAPLLKLRETVGNNPLARIKAAVSDVRGNLTPLNKANPYLSATLYPGIVAGRIKQLSEDAVEAVKYNMDTAVQNISAGMKRPYDEVAEELNSYMQAKTAADYNREHQEYTAQTGKPASGMSDAQAQAKIAAVQASPYGKVFEDIRQQVRDLGREAMQIRVDGGLITKDEAAALQAKYPEHVPLNRVLDEDANPISAIFGVPRFNVLSSGVKSGYGSERAVDDILTSTMANLKDAVIRAEKNKVGQAALEFYRTTKPSDVEIMSPTIRGTGTGGIPIYADPPSTALVVREPGPGGKTVQKWVNFEDPLLARAFNGIGVQKTDPLLSYLGKATGALSSLYTKFNPSFTVNNKIRDVQDVFANLATSGDLSDAAKTALGAFTNMKAVADAELGRNTPGAQLFKEAEVNGAFTGGLANASRDAAAKDLARMSPNQNLAQKAVKGFQGAVNFVNTVANESTFLSVYKEARDQGATAAEAAMAARKSSIDFNLKSPFIKSLGSLYAFVGPGIHGATNSAKLVLRSPRTIAEAGAAFMGAGLAIDAWNSSIDPQWKDKKQNDFYRQNSIPILLNRDDDGYYVFNLPIAQMLRPIKGAVDMGLDLASNRKIDAKTASQRLAQVTVDSLNPIGGQNLRQAVTPTALDPAGDIWANQSYTGSKVHPDDSTSKLEYEKVFPHTITTASGQAAIDLARMLHNWGIEVSPDSILYGVKGYGGGPAGLGIQAVNAAGNTNKPAGATRPSDLPFIGNFLKYVRNDAPMISATQDQTLDQSLQAQADREIARRGRLQENVDDLRNKNAPISGVADRILSAPNPVEAAKDLVNAAKKNAQRPPNEDFAKIGNLKVETGDRANYILQKVQTLPSNEIPDFINGLAQAGYLTPEVYQQLNSLAAQRKPAGR